MQILALNRVSALGGGPHSPAKNFKEFEVFCARLRETKALDALFFQFRVRQRLIRIGCLMCDNSFPISPPLLLEYFKAKIQMLSVFSWQPALEMPWCVKNANFPIFKSALLQVNSNCGGKFDKLS